MNPKRKTPKQKRIFSPIKKKIILLLAAGFTLAMTPSSRRHGYVFRSLSKEWVKINRQYLRRLVEEFKYERLVDWRERKDGVIEIVLSEKGKHKAFRFNIDEMKIKQPLRWDGLWRIVFFDVPEKQRQIRDALRDKLKELGFYELQKSVFVCPWPCLDEINFIVEFFEARRFVRFGEVKNLTNNNELKLHFGLT